MGAGGLCAYLLNAGSWRTRDVFERYRRAWEWLLKGSQARPAQLPDIVETEIVAHAPSYAAGDHGVCPLRSGMTWRQLCGRATRHWLGE